MNFYNLTLEQKMQELERQEKESEKLLQSLLKKNVKAEIVRRNENGLDSNYRSVQPEHTYS